MFNKLSNNFFTIVLTTSVSILVLIFLAGCLFQPEINNKKSFNIENTNNRNYELEIERKKAEKELNKIELNIYSTLERIKKEKLSSNEESDLWNQLKHYDKLRKDLQDFLKYRWLD
jgi:hypothetical protein